MVDTERKLLAEDVHPICYTIRLEPDFLKQNFLGRVDINCNVVRPTQVIQLHSKLISITAASLEWEAKHWDILNSLRYVEDDDLVEIQVREDLPAGAEIVITLEYTGNFKKNLEGLYCSGYKTADGKAHELAVTFLEPTCARQVFPCFDEPNRKAEFAISAVVDASFLCASNMPIEREVTVSKSKKLVIFQKSPLMSTYLVGLVAGNLSRVDSTSSRIPLSVLCPNGSERQASFALELASDALTFFETLFDDRYPLPKLDLVAVPDFSSGAMENWGLITFRTSQLLIDTENSALDTKQAIARTVLHEIAHSWFGNLVTMKYWDGLWLKEGCATLLAWYASDKLFPSWHSWDTFIMDTLQAALELDSLESSHPVELVVRDATKAKQMFDHISYKKGCCILKMLLEDLGEERFFRALGLYTRRHKFGNTRSEDLWRAFQDCGDATVPDRMRVWTEETGFPVILVTEEYNNADKTSGEVTALRLRQERFLVSGKHRGPSSNSLVYPLRVSVRSDTGIDVYGMDEQEIVIPVRAKTQFLKVNADHRGFFRTSYTPRHLQKLIKAAQATGNSQLPLRDCIGLLADILALTTAGINKTSELLDICFGFRSITPFSVWQVIDKSLTKVLSVFKYEDAALRKALTKAAADIFGSKAQQLGWEMSVDDNERQAAFKASMFSAAGLAGDDEVVKEARRLFAARIDGNEDAISPQLRWEVFVIVITHGGQAEAEALLSLWRTSPNDDERYLALECLGRVSDASLVRWALGLVFTDDVKDQDIFLLFWLMGSSAHGASELWEWTKANWATVEQRLPANMQALILGLVLEGLNTSSQLEDVKAYFAGRDTREYDQTLAQKIEGIETRMKWVERDVGDVGVWLKSHGYWEERD
ncbi:peptidase family M1-domain-containing protein [Cercophora samala]|uniref:Aminopeptidase n=1 Tax=Cercophora samala TaxID=330535 RepID=A0AA39ZBU7_9PEZI|nr:peptidase family M1-domain-containing protein [Cercophora samala]